VHQKETRGGIPDVARRNSNGHMYILREYKDEMKGKKIPDGMVISAENGCWFTEDKVTNFVMKSSPGCPTYGVCDHCFGSVPVHMLCQKCRRKGQRYIIAKRNGKILDAEWVLRFFGTSHVDVRADTTQNWITQRIWTMSKIQLQIHTQCRWPARKLLKEENPKFWCKYMEIFDDGVTVNGTGLWDAIENPVKILRWDDPNEYHGEDEK
jgi:hypothetical protein